MRPTIQLGRPSALVQWNAIDRRAATTRHGDNTTGPVPSQMGTASITRITTTKISKRTGMFTDLDLMDASLPQPTLVIMELVEHRRKRVRQSSPPGRTVRGTPRGTR